jgi:hypothetical protein
MRWNATAVVVLSCGFIAAACSGSTTNESGGTPVPADQFVTRFVDAVCDSIGNCCQAAGFSYNREQCKTLGYIELGQEFEPNVPPNVKYDATAAGNCIQAAKNAALTCGAFDLDDEPSCAQIFNGTLQPGASCTADYECADSATDDAYCDQTVVDQPGVCVLESQLRGNAGDACGSTCTEDPDGSGTSCTSGSGTGTGPASCFTNDGLYCDQTCKPLIAIGQACIDFESCVTGAFCNQGTCAALPSAGQPCAQGYLCADDVYCSTAGSCEPRKPEGASCLDSTECVTDRCRDGLCAKDTIVSQELCSGVAG